MFLFPLQIVGSEHACYNSIASYDSKLFVLGLKVCVCVCVCTTFISES